MKVSEIAALLLSAGAITFIGCYTAHEIYKWAIRRKQVNRWWEEQQEWLSDIENTGPCHNWKKEGF